MKTTQVPRVGELLHQARQSLEAAAVGDSPSLDVELLLAHVLECDRAFLFSHSESSVSTDQCQRFQTLLERRTLGEPIAYLVNNREFWSLSLYVDERVLVPRPETETLIECLLQQNLPEHALVADLGTGSGAVALALACERPGWFLVASDRQRPALAVAAENKRRGNASNVALVAGDWLQAFADQSLDVVVSNPPYIAADDPHLEQSEISYEPRSALVSDGNGCADIAIILRQSMRCLRSGGVIILEHGYQQGGTVALNMKGAGFTAVTEIFDLGGRSRAHLARKR